MINRFKERYLKNRLRNYGWSGAKELSPEALEQINNDLKKHPDIRIKVFGTDGKEYYLLDKKY